MVGAAVVGAAVVGAAVVGAAVVGAAVVGAAVVGTVVSGGWVPALNRTTLIDHGSNVSVAVFPETTDVPATYPAAELPSYVYVRAWFILLQPLNDRFVVKRLSADLLMTTATTSVSAEAAFADPNTDNAFPGVAVVLLVNEYAPNFAPAPS
jgi:hypothetical protein